MVEPDLVPEAGSGLGNNDAAAAAALEEAALASEQAAKVHRRQQVQAELKDRATRGVEAFSEHGADATHSKHDDQHALHACHHAAPMSCM